VTLNIAAGERVGIIGRNGAGKSTLLRAIAGIYPLASGEVDVAGSLQSLFEIGLGFEGEATGRENILFRGLVMGCTPEFVRAREAEIVAFADLGEFIDMPIRTYSAGMVVRLAFAISSMLDADILLIDEVFGAGDAAFQAKAVRRLEQMIDRASIVVMVGHDLPTIEKVCSRAMWLDKGCIKVDGPSKDVVERYLSETT
jgi:lipopolysaccharide transport system ATP-binding protein